MARIGTRLLTLSIGGTDVTAQCSTAEITSEETDSDFVSFADAAAGGGRTYKLHIVAVQDAATGTVWDKVWSAAGTTVAYILKPYGNATASVSQPHYTGSAVITEPDGVLVGGEADASTTNVFTFEVEWTLTDKPTKTTT